MSSNAPCSSFHDKRTIDLNFTHFDDENEPYVYVQTFQALMNINQKLHHILIKNPGARSLPINILLESSWPVPWLFGDFSHGYFAGRPIPTNPDAMLILIDASLKDDLESHLKHTYFKQIFRLRSAQGESIAYFDATVFKDEFVTGTPLFVPHLIESLKPDQGLKAKFFTNNQWQGPPAHVKHVAGVDFTWAESERPLPSPFSILFEGELFIPQDGPVIFSLVSAGASTLEIDDVTVINNEGFHSEKTVVQLVSQIKGWHKMKVRYNDNGAGMIVRLSWKLEHGAFELIGQEFMRPTE